MKRVESEIQTKETASLEKSVAQELTLEDRDMEQIIAEAGQEKKEGDEDTE